MILDKTVTSARDVALFVGIGLLLLDFDHRPTAPVAAADEEEDDEESEDSGRRSLRSTSRSSPPNNSLRDDDVERCLQ